VKPVIEKTKTRDANTALFHAPHQAGTTKIGKRSVMPSRWKTGLWIVGSVALAMFSALIAASVVISQKSHDWMQDWLSHEYDSDVGLSSFNVSIPFPLVQTEANNVTLHFRGRHDLPPLIAIKRLTMRTSITGLLRSPRRISFVHLEGLQINIPPREDSSGGEKIALRRIRAVRFDEILSEDATIKILTAKPGKDPLEFDIRLLRVNSSGADGALAFQATLSNPKPPGQIASSGLFGPWNATDPSQTPVSGGYTFENADLGVFPGIAGILSSKGTYQGALDHIIVDGTTNTPDFCVTLADHPVDLSTTFHAMVDGANGDTFLQSVNVHFGQTDLVAQGTVEGAAGKKGKTISLDVSTSHARINDLLLLAVKNSPPMTGPIHLKTKFNLVPGPKQIPDRLALNGFFELDSLHFTSSEVQQKVDNMSKRSQGKPKEIVDPKEAISSDDVASAMKGNFSVEKGILSLTGLNFDIPGAEVQLDGDYALEPETLDLHGTLKMQAKLSQINTGVKSFLLRFADPIFSKGGNGAVLPIKITGSVQHPQYGLDLGHKADASGENR
jgi:AsmA-like protein